MNPVFLVPAAVVGFIVGGIFFKEVTPPPQPPSPVNLADMRTIVAALEPFENGSSWERASVCVRSAAKDKYGSPATVGIEFHPKRDTKLYGWGSDIPSAVADLSAGADVVRNILGPLVSKGTAP